MALVKTHDQLDAFAWQSDLLIQRLLEKGDAQRAISLLEERARHAVWEMKDGVSGYRDATRLIGLVTEHRSRLEDHLGRDEINDMLHNALELRFAAPSSNSVLLGAAEDMIGFEIGEPAFLTDASFAETCAALTDAGLVGPSLSLQLIAKNHLAEHETPSLGSILMEWMPDDYFDRIDEYWTIGEGHLFGWRIPRMSAAEYIKHLTKVIVESDDREQVFAQKMLVSAAQNSGIIETIGLTAV